MSGSLESDDKPQFRVVTKGILPLKLVEIVRDNRIVYSVQPNTCEHTFQYTDMDRLGLDRDLAIQARCASFEVAHFKPRRGESI